MKQMRDRAIAVGLSTAALLGGCQAVHTNAGAPGAPRVLSQAELRKAPVREAQKASRADVEFFQGMIPHHLPPESSSPQHAPSTRRAPRLRPRLRAAAP